MKVLLTGAFGNLGANTLLNLLKNNKHEITCFDMDNPRNRKEEVRLSKHGEFDTFWGDITQYDSVKQAVDGQECILHLAAIIPPLSEQNGELAHKVNVIGTNNIIEAAKHQKKKPKIVFTSSVTVHGNRYNDPPPRKAHEDTYPCDNYTHSKVESENALKASGLDWTILRVGAATPIDVMSWSSPQTLEYSFGIPLDQRIEVIHPADVATAIANSVEADTGKKILYLGGGKDCQMTNKQFQTCLFNALGIGMVHEKAFKVPKDDSDYWYTDFMDTEESQRLLKFQNHSFENYLHELKKAFGWKRYFTIMLGPIIRRWLVRYSPYYKLQTSKV